MPRSKAYRGDLIARNANPYNAEHAASCTSPAGCCQSRWCCSRPRAEAWRDGLMGAMAPATINRLCHCICAALALAAQHDKRIKNRDAWESGLPVCRMRRGAQRRTPG